ncbi:MULTISPECIES: FRG domain-containing protein [Corallococcus]|uniref:FRG domain-containing protein n=1 Tax=Corallococcus TaxID=83461 RepID=UPI000EEAAC13|nr:MULTISPECIES: FRG domain-containing protein [Corallococcus]NPC76336.1 FRG domain-containing protein [Corallococcus exiguus]NPD29993.1 FRG domain-containing protein [Corallococcus exiguus]RKI03968.1 FRG domain-containing protein [Corallococcus sp. AB038B]
MQEHRVTSWLELQDLVFAGSWNEPLGRFRTSFVFRGVPDATLDLTATLNRQGAFVRLERDLLRAFRKYARGVPGTERLTSIWDWLALAQHHGMPTRLLDWTFSPYVALHFMTERMDLLEQDGAVWCVDYHQTNQQLPRPLREQLRLEGADVFTAEMLATVAGDLATFDGLGEHPFVLFFEPPSLDARIVNQFALFSVMNGPGLSLNEFLGHQHQGVRRLVVPARLKWEIRDKLDQANITERVLFPGLDGLSRWLRRYYAPRPR